MRVLGVMYETLLVRCIGRFVAECSGLRMQGVLLKVEVLRKDCQLQCAFGTRYIPAETSAPRSSR